MTDGLTTAGLLLGAGLIARTVASWTRTPEILLFVLAGVLAGPHVTGLVDVPPRSPGVQLVFTIGVSLILFHGGLNLSVRVLRGVGVSLALLAIPGVVVTAAVCGVAARVGLGLPWDEALLVGAVLAPTDPAILIPLFLRTRLRTRLAQTVIAESAFNDPTGAVLALTLAGVVMTGDHSVAGPVSDFLLELLESAGIGLVAGGALAAVMSSHRVGLWRESPAVAALAIVVISYVSLDTAGGSGYLGAFLAGLVVGNMDVLRLSMHEHHDRELRSFVETSADLATLLVFLVLGANLSLSVLADHLGGAIVVVGTLVLVARPVAVLLCTAPDRRARWTRAELGFMCWTRETGVVPAALVGLLGARGVPGADVLSGIVALAVIATLVLQAMPAEWLAGRLGLLGAEPGPGAERAAEGPVREDRPAQAPTQGGTMWDETTTDGTG